MNIEMTSEIFGKFRGSGVGKRVNGEWVWLMHWVMGVSFIQLVADQHTGWLPFTPSSFLSESLQSEFFCTPSYCNCFTKVTDALFTIETFSQSLSSLISGNLDPSPMAETHIGNFFKSASSWMLERYLKFSKTLPVKTDHYPWILISGNRTTINWGTQARNLDFSSPAYSASF